MTKKYRIGVIGFAHMHVNNLAAQFAAHPRAELACCADTVPDRPELREGGGKTEIHQPEPLPPGHDQLPPEMISHLDTGAPLHPTLKMMFNLDVMAILDAGFRASNSGKIEMVEYAARNAG